MNTDWSAAHADVTREVIGAFFRVYNALGFGFLESVYKRALVYDLRKHGVPVDCEVEVDVLYDGVRVGRFRLDLLVRRSVVVELKTARRLAKADYKQLLNCLRATNLEVGLLLNFGEMAVFKRLLWDNHLKPGRQASPSLST